MSVRLTVGPGAGPLPRRAGGRARRRARSASSPAASASSATATSPASARRCSSTRDLLPVPPGPQRAGDGPHRGRLRAPAQPARHLRVHQLGRPGRDEHGHRRGARHDQPPAGAAAAGRHVRHARAAPGAAAARGAARRDAVGQRLLPAGLALLRPRSTGPSSSCPAALEAMRVLTDPAETGAVTLALPEDVQTEAFEVPGRVPRAARVDGVPRSRPRPDALARAAELVRGAQRPLIVAGGGVIYAEATDGAARARRGHRHPGRRDPGRPRRAAAPTTRWRSARSAPPARAAANRLAREADLVIGIGTRWSDFTTASKSAFQDPGRALRERQRRRASTPPSTAGWPLVGDARVGARGAARARWPATASTEDWERRAARRGRAWAEEVERLVHAGATGRSRSQAEVIGAVNDAAGDDRRGGVRRGLDARRPAQALARPRPGKGYHVEYGYSCMGYEIPGGIGVKLAAPEREVFVMVGDGSYLMLPGELVTAVAEGIKHRRRARGQPRLRLDRRAVALGGSPASARTTGARGRRRCSTPPTATPGRRRAAAGRPRRERREPRRCGCCARARSRSCATRWSEARGGERARRRAHRGRPLRGRPGLRGLVGRARGRGLGRPGRAAPRASEYERARAAQRSYVEPP